jgi:hypothetical protein
VPKLRAYYVYAQDPQVEMVMPRLVFVIIPYCYSSYEPYYSWLSTHSTFLLQLALILNTVTNTGV